MDEKKNVPTKAGWYWYRGSTGTFWVVRVESRPNFDDHSKHDLLTFFIDSEQIGSPVASLQGEWGDRIDQPPSPSPMRNPFDPATVIPIPYGMNPSWVAAGIEKQKEEAPQNCGNCRFGCNFYLASSGENLGVCKRYPPKMVARVTVESDKHHNYEYGFTEMGFITDRAVIYVVDDEWCGEWKPNPSPKRGSDDS